ncbi:MAG TPA: ACT domain-containing protein [Candidatus Acidoferrum sp.]|jgi:hypothetical protein
MTLTARTLTLTILPERFAILRFVPDAKVPAWAEQGTLFSVTRTRDELSIICEENNVPPSVAAQKGWRSLQVHGPFALNEVGVLSTLASALAAAGVSILAVSTFDTDYLFVAGEQLHAAISALTGAGHTIHGRESVRGNV